MPLLRLSQYVNTRLTRRVTSLGAVSRHVVPLLARLGAGPRTRSGFTQAAQLADVHTAVARAA